MLYNRKTICIGVIKAVSFLLFFLILFQYATDLFRTKEFYYQVSPVYDLPKNSVDVLLFGSSHMNTAISPMDLWNDYGITSFNAGIGDQTIPATYFELRELLKVQKPKVVVIETVYIFNDGMMTAAGEERLHWLVDNVPLSFGISEAIQTLIQEDHPKTEYYLNFYNFHNRWKELSEADFKPSLQSSKYNRGADMRLYNLHSVIEYPTVVPRNETEIPPELPLEYLHKIIELCREKGIELVFMAQPYYIGSEQLKMMNYVDVVVKDYHIPYVNFFYLLNEIDFDFAKDMAEAYHMNYFGVKKLTSYLGEYLQTNYQLEDHRRDPAIADLWNRDYETFVRELNNIMMKSAYDTDTYLDYLQKMEYIIAWNAYSETPLSETALPGILENMGIDSTVIGEKVCFCAITKGDELLYGKALDIRPNVSYMTDDIMFSFGGGFYGRANRIGVHVGRQEYSVGATGLNLVIYDPVTRMVVDSVNIDLATKDIQRK